MKTMSNYLIIMLTILLLIFRLVVLITATMEINFAIKPINIDYEIALIFIMLFCTILISKNKLSGAIILTIASIAYYGPSLLGQITGLSSGVSLDSAMQVVVSMVCIVIPIVAFFIIAFAKEQEKRPVDKKTDFFYKTDKYDIKYDDRADKNNYRTM